MQNKPIATIIVVTRNRPEILQKMLNETRKQKSYGKFEVIVADDCGMIDVKKELEIIFPEVNFIRFTEHRGYISARSAVFKNAESDFVFFLDDDSWFDKEDAVVNATEVFKNYPKAAILNFGIRLPNMEIKPQKFDKQIYVIGSFVGCANAIRKSVFENSDIYDGNYFRQGEERDLSIKCLEKGYDILQVNDIIVYHEQTDVNRDHQFIHGYAFRNEAFFYLKFFPGIYCPTFILRCFVSHTIFCLKKGWLKAYLFGIRSFIFDFFKFFKKRKPVKMETFKKYIRLNKENRIRTYS